MLCSFPLNNWALFFFFFFTQAMHLFSYFISKHGLIDLPLEGGNFTWSNSREVVSRSRLDRFLVIANWGAKFLSVCQKRLSRLVSDHCPIILEGYNFHRGKRPFWFENMWLTDEGFVDKIHSWWESYHFHGALSFILASKLKALKVNLKKWNVEEFGNVEEKGKKMGSDLGLLETVEESRVLMIEEKLNKERIS